MILAITSQLTKSCKVVITSEYDPIFNGNISEKISCGGKKEGSWGENLAMVLWTISRKGA
ncbi:MAG: hypothetical protein D8B53_02615 [Corynebacterium sp.]|nr:MAG: hypothetical protein D8B53_02615 [Corynebacterium sp.]